MAIITYKTEKNPTATLSIMGPIENCRRFLKEMMEDIPYEIVSEEESV